GHWNKWNQDAYTLDVAIKTGTPIPMGKEWSDTRVMAWLCAIYGHGFMDWIGEKGIAYGPEDIDIFTGRDAFKLIDGVYCSNDYFRTKHENKVVRGVCGWEGTTAPLRVVQCKLGTCTRTDIVAGSGG